MFLTRLGVADLPKLVTAAQSFADESKNRGGMKPESFISSWTKLIQEGIGVVWGIRDEANTIVGALGAVRYNDMFNGDLCTVVNFWYVLPEHRGQGMKLLNEFEKWSRQIGAKRAHMIHLKALQPEVLRKLYERRGYVAIETNYSLIL